MFKKMVLFGIILFLTLATILVMAAPDPLFYWANPPTTLTFYGQSTFLLTHGETLIVIDPWFTGNPWKSAVADDIEA